MPRKKVVKIEEIKNESVDIGSVMVENADDPTTTPENMKKMENESTQNETTEQATERVAKNGEFNSGNFSSEPQAFSDVFNPEIHCSGQDGNGIRTASGKWRKKRGKNGSKSDGKNYYAKFAEPAPISTLQIVQMCLDNSTMIASKFWGEEWKLNIDEREQLSQVYSRYIHCRGWDDAATPETAVIGVTVLVLLPRLLSPKFHQWIKENILGNKNAHANNRPDAVRKNDAGESNRSPSGKSGYNGADFRSHEEQGVGGQIRIRSIG